MFIVYSTISPQKTGTNIKDLKLQINFDVREIGKFHGDEKVFQSISKILGIAMKYRTKKLK
jgi:hypothetical protein